MRISRSWGLFFSAIIFLTAGEGASATLSGFVLDATSGEPLPVANIWVEGGSGTFSNKDGYFVLPRMQPGAFTVVVSYIGYETTRQSVTLGEDPAEPLRVELNPQALLLEPIVVEETSEDKGQRTSPRVSTVPVAAPVIRGMPSLAGEMDVLRALQTIPGVKSSSDMSSALYVRGCSPEQTLILMDHNVVYNPSHLFGIFSTFNADAVKHLELIKGGFPAEYGGRSGSVLEVITNEGNRKRQEGMFSLGIVSARAALEGPLPHLEGSYAISGRRTYLEPILNALRKENGDIPSYYFYDTNMKVNLDLPNSSTLTLAGYLGEDEMNGEFGDKDDPIYYDVRWGNRTFTSRFRHVLNQETFLSLGAAASEYRSDWQFVNDDVTLEEAENRLSDYSFKTDIEYQGLPNHKLKAGLWASLYSFSLLDQSEDIVYVNVDTTTLNISLYGQDSWRINPLLEVQAGLRGYYHQAGKHIRVDPRMAIVYHYDPLVRFKLSGGRYTQWINLLSFGEGFSNFDVWIPVDSSMEPGYNDQLVAGIEWDRSDNLECTFEAYYTDMKNIATFDILTDEGDVADDAFVTGEGYAYGFEWMLRRTRGPTTGWLGYSLSWTRRHFPDSQMNSGNWYYPKWDRRHDITAVVNRRVNDRWDISGSWRYNTGQGFTQALGLYTERLAGIPPEYYANDGRIILPGEKNNYRFPADHRLDITATWKHRLFGKDARLNLSLYNVYSRRSYWQRFYDTQENPVKIDDIKLLPILPLVSYEVRF